MYQITRVGDDFYRIEGDHGLPVAFATGEHDAHCIAMCKNEIVELRVIQAELQSRIRKLEMMLGQSLEQSPAVVADLCGNAEDCSWLPDYWPRM